MQDREAYRAETMDCLLIPMYSLLSRSQETKNVDTVPVILYMLAQDLFLNIANMFGINLEFITV
jgi:hypothetical protein